MHGMLTGAGVALAMLLAACSGGRGEDVVDSRTQPAGAVTTARWVDNRLEVAVPVPVIAIGYAPADIAELRSRLRLHIVDHTNGDLNQTLPPDLEEAQDEGVTRLVPLLGDSFPHPVLPSARFDVQAAPAELQAEFAEALETVRVDGGMFDANAMEDWLAAALSRHGMPANPLAPSLVLLHLEAFGEAGHGWYQQGRTGHLAPVRVFGERRPLLVLDPSARPDPYAGSGDFRSPLATAAHDLIADFVIEAVEYRLLQASIYPIAQAPCHAVTAIVAIRPTSLSEATPLMRAVEDALHPEWIKGAFDSLTGTDVFFDLKLLQLPVDDPVLDVIGRAEFAGMPALRGWLSINFDDYHVAHEGCEAYLSVVFAGDVATVPSGILGIGTYDDRPGHRISMSWVNDGIRALFDPEAATCQVGCEGKDFLNWWDYLLIHETGHILGQRHTHDKSSNTGYGTSNNAFSSVWSTMSYQQDGRAADFGAIDHANWLRNRAGFSLLTAAKAGREDSPEFAAALDAARALDWEGVWRALR